MSELRIDPKFRDALALIWTQDRGERLKHVRWKRFFDQRELAEKLGVPQQVVSKIENGENVSAEISVRRLLEALTERHFLYVVNGTGAAAYGDIGALERKYKDYRFRIHRANRMKPITPQEEKQLREHAKAVIGEPKQDDGSGKGTYVNQRRLTK